MSNSNTYVAIMAGGVGSRFWPSSRESLPKQFLDILGTGKSLIQLTYDRFLALCPKENILIVTNKLYKSLVMEQLPDINESQVLCEPSRNNTAPCVAYTAHKVKAMNADANLIIAPSDHLILFPGKFIGYLKTALRYSASNDALVTLGIKPTRPDTGYGYIHFGKEDSKCVHEVLEFKEKPNLEKAKEYLDSGRYLWNGGIFIWHVDSILNAFERNAPEINKILGKDCSKYNTPEEQAYIDEQYPKTPSISVDYAIMEKSTNVYTIPAEFGWSDLGTWNSLYSVLKTPETENVRQGSEYIKTVNTKDCFIRVPKDKLAVIRDMEDYIIIDEDNVLLIYPKKYEQEIKEVTVELKKEAATKKFL